MNDARGPLPGDRFVVSQAYRSLWSVTGTALLGAGVLAAVLTVPVLVLLGLFAAVGLMIGGSAWAWSSVNLMPTRWAILAFGWSGLAAVAAVGLAELMGGWGLLALLAVGLGTPRLLERVVRTVGGTVPHGAGGHGPGSARLGGASAGLLLGEDLRFDDPHTCRLLDPLCPPLGKPAVTDLTVADLGRLWTVSGRWLGESLDDADTAHLVSVRADCLDELERRDPEALHRWLAASRSSATEPTRYMADGEHPPAAP